MGHSLISETISDDEYFGKKPKVKINRELIEENKEEELNFVIEEKERKKFEEISPCFSDYKFTKEQLEELNRDGVLVIPNVIDEKTCDEFIEEIKEFTGKMGVDNNDHNTFIELNRTSGFINLWHSPSYHKIRTNKKLYSIFAQVLKEPKLTVSIDRVNSKPPYYVVKDDQKIKIKQNKFAVHTDQSLWDLEENKFQGIKIQFKSKNFKKKK